jgi:hypothetical protein
VQFDVRMGTMTSQPYSVDDGEEYSAYLDNVFTALPKMQAEGRLPSDDAVLSFLDDMQRVRSTVRADVARARSTGAKQVVSRLTLTAADHRRLLALGESMQNHLQILEIRKALVLDRSAGAGRVADAFRGGTFED